MQRYFIMQKYHSLTLWMDGWMNGWMDGWTQAPTNTELTGIFLKQLSVIWEGPLWQISIDSLHKDSPRCFLCYEWRVWIDPSLGSSLWFRILLVVFCSLLAHNSHQQDLRKLSKKQWILSDDAKNVSACGQCLNYPLVHHQPHQLKAQYVTVCR